MADKGWKQFERRCAQDMGTTRIPVTGERDGADCTTEMFCFQFKLRSSLPDWLWRWLRGIVERARPTNRIGVLVLKHPHQRDTDALVVLRWRDWVDLHGPATVSPALILPSPAPVPEPARAPDDAA